MICDIYGNVTVILHKGKSMRLPHDTNRWKEVKNRIPHSWKHRQAAIGCTRLKFDSMASLAIWINGEIRAMVISLDRHTMHNGSSAEFYVTLIKDLYWMLFAEEKPTRQHGFPSGSIYGVVASNSLQYILPLSYSVVKLRPINIKSKQNPQLSHQLWFSFRMLTTFHGKSTKIAWKQRAST